MDFISGYQGDRMEKRLAYVKPSVLHLQYVEDVAVCSPSSCKSQGASSGQCLAVEEATSCQSPEACQAVRDS
jgi:hypothetical protein